MKALLYDQFGGLLRVEQVADPVPPDDGVVVEVRAVGVCRSDWHGWQGHDADIRTLPHVPGHEFAGVVAETGRCVSRWQPGDRVTMPFVAGCGVCEECQAGAAQVCPHQFQPGFTAWGAFAERVAVRYADFNLVPLPQAMDFDVAAGLGCRTATAYRAVALQGAVRPEQWVAVHGCGGVGLAAVMAAAALGARVIAIDVQGDALTLAQRFGAEFVVDASSCDDVVAAILDRCGGAHVSLDCLGSAATATNSLLCLRRRGRHVQVGLLAGDDFRPRLPWDRIIAYELAAVGSHGLAAADYGPLMRMTAAGQLPIGELIQRRIRLSEAGAAIAALPMSAAPGTTVVTQFD
ncbi:MAG: alcohol dehydrogenase catalytic domain-containing protein [Planctomycetales bacterium]|nr:alcohol dehydrogenase catalytic domain-containing protein [Planctomycetales bacterium]